MESGSFYYLPVFGLLFSLRILAGHPPTVIYTVMLVLAFMAYQLARKAPRMDLKKAFSQILPLLFACILAALVLTLPQTGLFLELMGMSSRGRAF